MRHLMIYFWDGLGLELREDDQQKESIHYSLRPYDYCIVDIISNPQKRKHHGRFCRLFGTYRYYYNNVTQTNWLRATVKFVDNGKIGYIDPIDLLAVSSEQFSLIHHSQNLASFMEKDDE